MANRVRPLHAGSLILLLALAGSTTVIWAQGAANPAATVAAASATGAAAAASTPGLAEVDSNSVRLTVGRSAILNVGSAITRVSLTSADVADAMVTSPGQLLINGKVPGTISMFVWDKAGSLKRYEVTVQRDLTQLSDQMRQLFPNQSISVQSTGKNVVLHGSVQSKDLIEKAVNVASGYVDKKDDVVSLLQIQNPAPATQVLLRVRFAEVSRSAITELGASMFTSPIGVENNIGRITTQQFPAPSWQDLKSSKVGEDWQKFGHEVTTAEGKLSVSDFLNFFLFNEKYDLGIAIKALQSKGLFQSLAEPNLVAETGKDASFLAGGEFPIPVVQGSGANLAINVVFKEFGIRLNFTPEVNGDRIHLKVRPEVSALDFSNAVLLQGFRIPALTTRRTETELELRNGQTFAISGLLNNSVNSTLSKVPGIGDIPILGLLFKSKAAQKNQTELVVMITPEILGTNSRGVTPNLPRGSEQYLAPIPERNLAPVPPEAFEGARRGVSVPDAPASNRSVSLEPAQPKAEQAASAVSALTPSATRRMADSQSSAAVVRPPAVADRPLTADEKKALERAKKADEERERERAKVEARDRAAKAAADKKAAELQKERDAKAAREQAKRDAEAQKKAEEEARRELIRQRDQQRAMDEAAAQLKAAQERYESIAKSTKQ
jgi:pilus assembly protein CpaC